MVVGIDAYRDECGAAAEMTWHSWREREREERAARVHILLCHSRLMMRLTAPEERSRLHFALLLKGHLIREMRGCIY